MHQNPDTVAYSGWTPITSTLQIKGNYHIEFKDNGEKNGSHLTMEVTDFTEAPEYEFTIEGLRAEPIRIGDDDWVGQFLEGELSGEVWGLPNQTGTVYFTLYKQ